MLWIYKEIGNTSTLPKPYTTQAASPALKPCPTAELDRLQTDWGISFTQTLSRPDTD